MDGETKYKTRERVDTGDGVGTPAYTRLRSVLIFGPRDGTHLQLPKALCLLMDDFSTGNFC